MFRYIFLIQRLYFPQILRCVINYHTLQPYIHQHQEEDQFPGKLGVDKQYHVDDHRSNTRHYPVHIIRLAENLGQHRHLMRVENHRSAKDIPEDTSAHYRADVAVEI